MSDNQEEFNALRKAAYSFVNEHGKDADALRSVCEDFMRRWREVRGPKENDDRRLINDVVRWTMNRYNRPRYRPKRTREERAAIFLMTPGAYQMSGEDFGRASIRNTARITGQSKSTVGRHLLRQGIAPRRQARIRKLSKTGQRLLSILDETFERRASGLVQTERLTSALWDGTEPREVPATTQASRTKKLKQLLNEISTGEVGYSIAIVDDVCGIHRGRRFPSLSEAATWIAEEKRLNRYAPIQQPPANQTQEARYFWADPVVVDVMSIIDMAFTGHFYPVEKMDAIFRFERLLIDPTPIYPWLERARHSYAGDDMPENLSNLSDMITDPAVKRAVRRLAKIMRELHGFIGTFPPCFDALQTADMILGIMDKVAVTSPESYARLAYIRGWFEQTGLDYHETRDELSHMLDFERSGEWLAPNADTLSLYLPTPSIDTADDINQ